MYLCICSLFVCPPPHIFTISAPREKKPYLVSCYIPGAWNSAGLYAYLLSHSVMSDSCNPMDCNPPGSSVQGILQARILDWIAISFSRGSSQPGDWTCISYVSCVGRQVLYHWSHLGSPYMYIYILIHCSIVDSQHCVSFRCTVKWFSYISIYSFSNCFPFNKVLNMVPCAIWRFLFICFIYNSMYLLNLNS